jgi:uncharacterized surface protein with fasciclin (FAS1) repeats
MNRRIKRTTLQNYLLTFTVFLAVGIKSCIDPIEPRSFYSEEIITITDYIEKNKDEFSSFWRIMEVAELTDPLTGYNPLGDEFTLFLPTDEAFERFISSNPAFDSFEDLLDNRSYVRELARYHLVNKSFNTNEFPYGALPDTTATGDFLTIGFSSTIDTTYYKINNVATVEKANIEVVNGYIHVIGDVLEPIVFNSFEWLRNNGGFSILSGVLELTGLVDTMGIYREASNGQMIKNRYSVLAEHDSIYHRNGIYSVDDMITRYGTPGLLPTDPDNQLYQFAAYHLLEGSYFLDEFTGSTNYNTYANFPVHINAAGIEIRINTGADVFRYDINDGDTTLINYISMFYQESNQLTKNGAIHMISEIMELFRPSRSNQTFQFHEEPQIASIRNIYGIHEFVDADKFEFITWSGPESIYFVKAAGDRANGEDYLLIDGNFILEYTIPKLIPGKYRVTMKAHSRNQDNATIQIFLDDRKLGGNYDLSTGGTAANPYAVITISELEFSSYKEHVVRVKSLIPGQFIWDYISFIPV